LNQLDLKKLKNDLITELYLTGRSKGLYMGVSAKSKENPLKKYIERWLYTRGIKNVEEHIDDYYNELFVHISKLKDESFIEFDRNPKKFTATACWIAKIQLFLNEANKKVTPKASYFNRNMYLSSQNDIKQGRDVEIIEWNEQDKDIDYIISTENSDVISEIYQHFTDEDKKQLEKLLKQKKRSKKDKEEFQKLYQEVEETINKIKKEQDYD